MAYELIETVELATNTSNIFLENIPQTFTDLKLDVSARRTDTSEVASLRFNDVATTNYSFIRLSGSGSTVGSVSGTTSSLAFVINASDFTSNTFSSSSFYISNYTSSTDKSISLDAVQEANATNSDQEIRAFLFTTSSGITKISVLGAFATGTVVSLYGIS